MLCVRKHILISKNEPEMEDFKYLDIVVQAGLLIVAIIGANQVSRNSLQKKIDQKADKKECDMFCRQIQHKADTRYVDKEITATNNRITESNNSIDKKIDYLIANQVEMQRDIKLLLTRKE